MWEGGSSWNGCCRSFCRSWFLPTALLQLVLSKSLAQVIQEQISCRKEFDQARQEFEQANAIDDVVMRLNAMDKIRRQVLLRCGVRP